jgi:hypothetical protein
LDVCHVSVADPPAWIVSGLTEIEAVGAGAGGGGGGGAGAVFLWQAPSSITALSAATVARLFKVLAVKVLSFISILFTVNPPANPIEFEFRRSVFTSNSNLAANYVL